MGSNVHDVPLDVIDPPSEFLCRSRCSGIRNALVISLSLREFNRPQTWIGNMNMLAVLRICGDIRHSVFPVYIIVHSRVSVYHHSSRGNPCNEIGLKIGVKRHMGWYITVHYVRMRHIRYLM